jgi:hypothetical protein
MRYIENRRGYPQKSYHTRLSASFLRFLMSDKPLAWASKLPPNAANFVGSIHISFQHHDNWWWESFFFILGSIYLFYYSSMLAICTAVRSAPVYMAAIVRFLQWTLFSLLYMLHNIISTHWLNNSATSHTYVDISSATWHILNLLDTIMSGLSATVFKLLSVLRICSMSRKGYGDADSGSRFLRRSSRPFLTDEISDLGERSPGGICPVSAMRLCLCMHAPGERSPGESSFVSSCRSSASLSSRYH